MKLIIQHHARLKFFFNRLKERLWVKPLMISLLSIATLFVAKLMDKYLPQGQLPNVSSESIEALLSISASSMLVMAVFAVTAMLSAYASASVTATPRSFPLVIADDASQGALSAFIGTFIFSVVGLTALLNGYFDRSGRFLLFLLTYMVFAVVIIRFIRWVDSIARLGRLGTVIEKVEKCTEQALRRRFRHPLLGAKKQVEGLTGRAVYADQVGYVQRIDLAEIQKAAEDNDYQVHIVVVPGNFVTRRSPLVYINYDNNEKNLSAGGNHFTEIIDAFVVGNCRNFDDDPRLGLIVLSEIASRALSPAVNDPGTAIGIIGSMVRLFSMQEVDEKSTITEVLFDRVSMQELSLGDMFDDAFNPIARDGAGCIEVMLRLQKALHALALLDDVQIREAATAHSQYALLHAESALKIPADIEILRKSANWSLQNTYTQSKHYRSSST
ncbi:DUF2254 domain-containing protein [Psychromonas sp.]|uniref:DUF2254 domain-containing protein n=1 Tax=Psychromonas sp. TaxID=1884585 RepID=UPI0035685CF9